MKRITDIAHLSTYLIGFILLLIPVIPAVAPGLFGRWEVIFFSIIFFGAVYLISLILQRKNAFFTISVADILVFLIVLYAVFNLLFVKRADADSFIIYQGLALLLAYISFRLIRNTRIIFLFLVFSAVIQSVWGLLQYVDLMESRHRLFGLTGAFGNPGPLGGYLSLGFLLSLGGIYIERTKAKPLLCFYIFSALIIGGILVLTQSRSAWLAVIVGIFVFAFQILGIKIKSRKRFIFLLCSAATAIIVSVTALYSMKKNSADGRLFIWKVTARMIADQPILGHGVDSFGQLYMPYQAEYFKDHPDSEYEKLADNVYYPYNEFLRVWVEFGLFGVLLVFLLLFVLFRYKTSDPGQILIKSALSGMLVFSFFSYPVTVFPLSVLFPVMAGMLKSDTVFRFGSVPVFRFAFCPILFFFICVSVIQIGFYRSVDKHLKNLITKSSDVYSINFVDDNYPELKANYRFMDVYTKSLQHGDDPDKYETALTQFIRICPSSDTYCKLGLFYQDRNDFFKAEEAFKTAQYMVPSRVNPRYLLFKLYLETKKEDSAIQTADKILHMQVKVHNSLTLRTRKEVKDFLKTKTGVPVFK